LKEEFKAAGISVWWDKTNMQGDMTYQMQVNVNAANFVLVLGTPLYAERAMMKDEVTGKPKGGVAIEVECMLEKMKTHPNSVVPVIFESDIDSQEIFSHIQNAVPECFYKKLVVKDFRIAKTEDYYAHVAGVMPVGIIPTILDLAGDDAYEKEWTIFESNVAKLHKSQQK